VLCVTFFENSADAQIDPLIKKPTRDSLHPSP
jgi:hypothetical protein